MTGIKQGAVRKHRGDIQTDIAGKGKDVPDRGKKHLQRARGEEEHLWNCK